MYLIRVIRPPCPNRASIYGLSINCCEAPSLPSTVLAKSIHCSSAILGHLLTNLPLLCGRFIWKTPKGLGSRVPPIIGVKPSPIRVIKQ